ncbi:hypothetical protein PGT21_034229 [Puccinia graminis f. sp. tritici]|uniref:GmrSD restriction endonucleases N-terminal domain-containing protein n=1 Tax=Puccinia graminis f. sp. tritici TaxID=56615 RepID=A0A5B0QQX6_PUCGR|nr:hypothetical protein PGT21_034229 [Puccinia graminis f. sp. tritici]
MRVPDRPLLNFLPDDFLPSSRFSCTRLGLTLVLLLTIPGRIMPIGYVTDSDNDTDQLDGGASESDCDDKIIPGALQSANCRVWSTRELYERMNNNTIDIAPPYQRDVVWTKPSQSALIDSILKNKWVPTLLFSERPASVDRHGKKRKARWVCMDGKQRLTSIKLFLDGIIPWYIKPKQPLFFKQSDPPQPSRKLLTEEQQEIFLSRGLTAAMYNQLNELQERDIFRLVQEGKPLTAGEKMHASSGPWGVYVNELTERYMVRNDDHPNGWCGRIANLTRGSDFKTMAQIVIMIRDRIYNSPDPPRFLTTVKVQKELDILSQTEVPEKLKDEIERVLDYFMDLSTLAPPMTPYTIVLGTPDALFYPIQKGKKTMIAPVEMVWIPYLIAVHAKELTRGKVLEMVELYKIDVRKKYPNEVKSNAPLTAWTANWIENFDLTRLQGKYQGWFVPRPTPQPVFQDETKPEGSGLRDMARRNLSIQTAAKRDAPTPDPTLASSPCTSTASLPKRPRRSIPGPAGQGAAKSPTIPFQPNRNSLPNDSTPSMRPVAQTRSNTNSSASIPPTSDALKARALAQRAQAVVAWSPNLMGNGQQSTASSLPSQTIAYHATDSGTVRPGALPQNGSRLVPNYPSRPSNFSLPNKPMSPNLSVIPQQQTNGNIHVLQSASTTHPNIPNWH